MNLLIRKKTKSDTLCSFILQVSSMNPKLPQVTLFLVLLLGQSLDACKINVYNSGSTSVYIQVWPPGVGVEHRFKRDADGAAIEEVAGAGEGKAEMHAIGRVGAQP